MGYRVSEWQGTPNPNAMKCLVEPATSSALATGGVRAYRTPDAARDDPLGRALMSVEGVTNVLIHDGWITIGKAPGASWRAVKAGVERACGTHAEP